MGLKRGLLIALPIMTLALVSAPGSRWTTRDKSYYLDANALNFIRPGLVIKVLDAQIDPDGTIKARFRITDPKSQPLDRDGIVTPGAVSVSLIAGFIPNSGRQYTSYTTRLQTSPITNQTATQAGTDANGTFDKVADGEYRYTFRTKAPAGFDRTATHSIGVYATRNLAEFDLGSQTSDDVYSWVPAGGELKNVRDVVRNTACNKCHDPLSAHGGARQSIGLCVMCHQPQTSDPDTGNTVDLPVMVHKIHMGENLPSVKAGKPYQIIGFNQTVVDFSKINSPTDVRTCTVCHESGTPQSPKDDKAWLKPNRAACGACHDNVNFVSGANHANLPQVSDNQCTNCHTPQGELEFDVSIYGAHTIPRFSRELPGTAFELLKVDNATPGQRPTVTFRLKDKSGKPLLASELNRLAIVVSGPTSDYAQYFSDDALKAQGSTDGTHTWTMVNPLPANAKGSFAVGIEGYRNVTILAGTTKQQVVRDAGANQVMYFSVDGSKVEPRRTIVSLEKCNSCHTSLSLHGDNRNRLEQCVLCHNPNENDRSFRPASEGAPQSVDFRMLIHRIHTGEELHREFTIFGFGGSKNDFSEVAYPGDRRNCSKCHVNGSEQLPLRDNLLPVNDSRGPIPVIQPTAAACTSCHTSIAAASHALVNTTALGESCAVCHGPNSDVSINKAHAR